MKSSVDGFDGVHLVGESAMHMPAPRSLRTAARYSLRDAAFALERLAQGGLK
ncbi:hypothetical protein PY257_04820 [Ramlibacter sp. H39-3-26]|uniref:hypothetical protein n=1 Tax=Curvibacter soli TaxID=3031331 RepID=UPI0023DC70ED|nr:hypothetical protein [Ramlibacter sp. H39-3-26]MDF1484508.1 hypothetical protein [Ramlibacter sp. H39-3-26]